jgi:hypothetical protein
LFTPPFHEHVPRPEFILYVPLLQILPALATFGANRDPAMSPAVINATSRAFFIDLPFCRDPRMGRSYLYDVWDVDLVPSGGGLFGARRAR